MRIVAWAIMIGEPAMLAVTALEFIQHGGRERRFDGNMKSKIKGMKHASNCNESEHQPEWSLDTGDATLVLRKTVGLP